MAFQPNSRTGNQARFALQAGVVDSETNLKIVSAVNNHIGHCCLRLEFSYCQSLTKCSDVYVRIDLQQALSGRFGLQVADTAGLVDDLPLQVG